MRIIFSSYLSNEKLIIACALYNWQFSGLCKKKSCFGASNFLFLNLSTLFMRQKRSRLMNGSIWNTAARANGWHSNSSIWSWSRFEQQVNNARDAVRRNRRQFAGHASKYERQGSAHGSWWNQFEEPTNCKANYRYFAYFSMLIQLHHGLSGL